jgi:hypothetical protein
MTCDEWAECPDPGPMLSFLSEHLGAGRGVLLPRRKERLFACACLRRVWDLLGGADREVVELLERFADGQLKRPAFLGALTRLCGGGEPPKADELKYGFTGWLSARDADFFSTAVLKALNLELEDVAAGARALRPTRKDERRAQADLVREVFGDPFEPVRLSPACRTADVLALAQGVYAGRAFERLPVLADALEDAGCAGAILDHCRSGGAHVRGCWALDLVLGLA